MNTKSIRTAIALACGSLLLLVADIAAATKVISNGPVYYGDRQVTKLYVYFFIDTQPEQMPDAFRRVTSVRLAAALQSSGISSEQLWFSDTAQGKILQSDIKKHTLHKTTFVPVVATIRENRERDQAFSPSHRLIVFPRETRHYESGAVFNVKWDVIDVNTGYIEWSVFTQTPLLSSTMDPAQAEAEAASFVDAIIQEMRDRSVIPREKN